MSRGKGVSEKLIEIDIGLDSVHEFFCFFGGQTLSSSLLSFTHI